MKTLKQLHHEDQMEAYRAEWAELWTAQEFLLRAIGFTDQQIAMRELEQWKAFLKSKQPR